jgi:hypothetical protein
MASGMAGGRQPRHSGAVNAGFLRSTVDQAIKSQGLNEAINPRDIPYKKGNGVPDSLL